ncbi:MAG: hypothetical protein MHMPM18_004264, partial [Marteilia pararefringens]
HEGKIYIFIGKSQSNRLKAMQRQNDENPGFLIPQRNSSVQETIRDRLSSSSCPRCFKYPIHKSMRMN